MKKKEYLKNCTLTIFEVILLFIPARIILNETINNLDAKNKRLQSVTRKNKTQKLKVN